MYFHKEVMRRIYEKKKEEEKAKSEPNYSIFAASKSGHKKNDNTNGCSHTVQLKLKEVFVKHGYSIIDDPKSLLPKMDLKLS